MDEVNEVDGNWYVLLFGLPHFDESLVLAPGLTLRPLDQPISVFRLAAAGAQGFRNWASLEPLTSGCTAEIESAKDADVTPGYDTLNRAWLVSALLALRGFTGQWGVACSCYSWNLIAGDKALSRFRGNLLDYHLSCFFDSERRTDAFSVEDALWVKQRFDVLNRLAAESESFHFALEAAIDWRFAKEPRSAVARLWGGIEALFGVSSELVCRISLYSACLLSERGETRKTKFAEIKRLYGIRSKVVHGEQLKEEAITKAMSESFHLLRDLLLFALDRGAPISPAIIEDAVFC